MKECFTCKEIKEDSEFNFRDKVKGTLQSKCRDCNKTYLKTHYHENLEYYKAKRKRIRLAYKTEIYTYILNYFKEYPCIDCGETDPIVLEFDHIHDKLECISQMISKQVNIDRIKNEINKCEVRCANCHNRRHAIENNFMLYRLFIAKTIS